MDSKPRQTPAVTPEEWRPDLDRSRRPIYLAIAEALAEDVRSGRLAAGTRMPTQRRLAQTLGVDLTTISRAYGEAQARGLVDALVGHGTFVKAPAHGPSRPPDLSMNLPPLFKDPALIARIWREAAQLESRGGLPLLLGYHDAGGTEEDKLAAAQWLQPRLPGVAPERIVISGGAQAGLMAIFSLICSRGDEVCADFVTYPGFRSLASQLGLAVIGLPADQDGLIPEAFEAICRRHPPKALYCTPTLHNPTTATIPADRRAAIARTAREFGVLIVEDDAYSPLKPTAPAPLASLCPEITYYVGGLAKVMSPALRLAYVVAPTPRDALRVTAIQRATIGRASPLTAMLATQWIRTGVAAALLEAIRTETRARYASVRRHLPRDAYSGDPDAFHIWLRLPPSWTRGLFASRLQAQGVTVVPSDAFCVDGSPPEAARLSVGAFPTRESLEEALGRIADLLEHDEAWDLPTV